jgi:D-ribitol-5-phosphate cytidylyltransferase
VRPFVSFRVIEENIALAREYGAVDTAIPATDTIVQSLDGKIITSIPQRSEYYQGQTPQSFNACRLKRLFEELTDEEKATLTDACKILVLKGEQVAMVRGDVGNMKLTYTSDMRIARAMAEDEGESHV